MIYYERSVFNLRTVIYDDLRFKLQMKAILQNSDAFSGSTLITAVVDHDGHVHFGCINVELQKFCQSIVQMARQLMEVCLQRVAPVVVALFLAQLRLSFHS